MGLEAVEIVMDAEDRFDVEIPDEVASKCVTVSDLRRVIVDLLVVKGAHRSSQLEAEVYAVLVKIIAEQTGMGTSEIRPDSRWVGDITRYG